LKGNPTLKIGRSSRRSHSDGWSALKDALSQSASKQPSDSRTTRCSGCQDLQEIPLAFGAAGAMVDDASEPRKPERPAEEPATGNPAALEAAKPAPVHQRETMSVLRPVSSVQLSGSSPSVRDLLPPARSLAEHQKSFGVRARSSYKRAKRFVQGHRSAVGKGPAKTACCNEHNATQTAAELIRTLPLPHILSPLTGAPGASAGQTSWSRNLWGPVLLRSPQLPRRSAAGAATASIRLPAAVSRSRLVCRSCRGDSTPSVPCLWPALPPSIEQALG